MSCSRRSFAARASRTTWKSWPESRPSTRSGWCLCSGCDVEAVHARLEVEQEPLAVEPAAVAGQAAVRADHAVAGHDQRHGVAAVRRSYRAGAVGAADLLGDLAIAAGLAVRDRQQRVPDVLLELGAAHVELDVELDALAREVLVELLDHIRERLACIAPLGVDAVGAHVQLLEPSLL